LTSLQRWLRVQADELLSHAATTAWTAINASIAGLPFIDHPLYAVPATRTTVEGQILIADGRPAAHAWVALSQQQAAAETDLHETTYFVRSDGDGIFSLPGIPPGKYSLYASSSRGAITGTFRQDKIVIAAPSLRANKRSVNLGQILWEAPNWNTFLWQARQSFSLMYFSHPCACRSGRRTARGASLRWARSCAPSALGAWCPLT
jgi:rhamnogalacturonan endolyase